MGSGVRGVQEGPEQGVNVIRNPEIGAGGESAIAMKAANHLATAFLLKVAAPRGYVQWIAREYGGLADVVETQVEEDDTLQANARARVRRRRVREGGDVVLERLQGHPLGLDLLLEELGFVHPLRAC